MEDALECGADDFAANDGVFEIITDPNEVGNVREALEKKGYTCETADPEYYPSTFTSITDEDAMKNMQKLFMN